MHWIYRGAASALMAALIGALTGALTAGVLPAGPLAAQQPPGASLPEATPLPPEGTMVVFVNTQVILPIAPGADSAQMSFERISQEADQELQGLAEEIGALIQAYQQQQSLLDPAGRQQKEQEIRDRQEQAAGRQQELNIELDRRRTELLAPILERVTAVIDEIRAEQSYSIVLDLAESGVVSADVSLDITSAVLERLGIDLEGAASGT